ncbi:translational activator GCN1 [Plectosphaerella plurivora]|uniref:eIF-2-alpha kinase activator GCN1 n=1 Tax=Plectosphaerella plurivora TaxID=936078 RepID=A0A9P8V1Z3_9PEZI|nr:translational activator GCN1 [Plectosphaerella plurivora]
MTTTTADGSGASANNSGFDLSTTEVALSSSSTATRIAHLRSLEAKISQKDIDSSAFPQLLELLFWTHAIYHDRSSRHAVQSCLSSILALGIDNKALSALASTLRAEAQKHGIASSNAFVLVEWCGVFMQQLAGTAQWDAVASQILLANADALERCFQPPTRGTVSKSAIVVTRRSLRKLFAPSQNLEKTITDAIRLLTAKGPSSTASNAILLGVFAGVSSRTVHAIPILEGLKSEYLSFYTRELVSSRTAIPLHIASGLHDFFSDFLTLEDLTKDIIPTLEKALLRAPEIVLSSILIPLVQAISTSYDLSGVLGDHLLKPLISNVKSSNPAIRRGAVGAFEVVVSRSHDAAALEKVTDELVVPLKGGKLASADHRVLFCEMISAIPPSKPVAEKIVTALAAVASKEGNEPAAIAETSALAKFSTFLLKNNTELSKTVADSFAKGLSDKKYPLRRIWILRAGEVVLNAASSDISPALSKFVDVVLPKMVETYTDVVNNPAAAAQNNIVIGAYVLVALRAHLGQGVSDGARSILSKISFGKDSLITEPKPSFLLNTRIYGKVTNEEELVWLTRALASVATDVAESTPAEVRTAWAQALIYLITAAGSLPQVRQLASQRLTDIYVARPSLVSHTVIEALWCWVKSVDLDEKDSVAFLAKSGTSNLQMVSRAICLTPKEWEDRATAIDKSLLEEQMCSLLVLARPDLMPRCSWIELCLRSDIDPGQLASKYQDALIEEILTRTGPEQDSAMIKQAAYNAAAELAFVAPDTMTPRIVSVIQQDLDAAQLKKVGPMEAAIFRTPEGQAFVDVLAKKSQNTIPDKNNKDYDILKWEAELRSQLAQKKGQEKKLSPEDAAKVKAQLKKEAEIRLSVQQLQARLQRGTGIIQSLASGPPTDATLWIGPVVTALLDVIQADSSLIAGDAPSKSYLACSNKISDRLGPMGIFVGAAALRARGISALPNQYVQESVESLVTRVLYRLRSAGEQRPFDPISLIYFLPLIFSVLENGGFGDTADDKDTQLVLAVEFLTYHTDTCQNLAVPRARVLSLLIESMERFAQHYKLIRDCFADACRCIAPNITTDEIGVLARGCLVSQSSVRTTVLQCISSEVDMSQASFVTEIWLACHDDIEENAELAQEIWAEGFATDDKTAFPILPYLESKDAQLRRAAARALAEACGEHLATIDPIIEKLEIAYASLAKPRVQELDDYGMPKKMDLSDPWEGRHGIGLAFGALSPHLKRAQLDPFFDFLILEGPLADKNSAVRGQMLDAAIAAIDTHGKSMVEPLMLAFERTLEGPDKNTEASDRVNEAVIIMYGALAKHLEAGSSKLPVVIERLIATLSTPSETVQYAIAECLPPLIRAHGDQSSKYFQQVMETLLTAKKYFEQRGAAYGLAGLVQGRGIASLKDYRILATLKGAIENKKDAGQREAALMAYELFSTLLGRLFEPYVIQIVPQLLTGFGDANANVRDACLAAAKACFAQLSSYGVKQILPTLLAGLDDPQWRSKKGACDLLGAMAYLDPHQLAMSLPDIIPPLTAVLNDSHKEVRSGANKSLKRFGEVINNPEVKGLVDILLKALSDPTKYTDDALDSLIKVQFVHYLDAPSLALVTRILQRGLGERSNTKRKAAQVIGSLAHLTERKDLVSHLPILVAGLKLAIVDPVPTTRATASRAMGSLVEKLGEDAMPDLIPGLMQTLKSDTGAGDRLGSAQALSEVLAGLGTTRLEETLPTILQNVESSKPAVREGFMSLFIFLPVCFGNSFANYLGRIIPPILAGLADDVESIRETALRAGRLLVKNFAMRAVDLLLPELERGLADDSYRIRLSSVELVGDLLFNLTGISGKAEPGEEEEEQEEMAREAGVSLREVLGEEKRNKVLSALYVCRCDTAGAVRSAAIGVWKALVSSPRTLKELVPTLTQLIIRRLGSSNMEHKVIASNALGELIRKAGDGVLSTLLPTLETGLQTSTDTDAKQGICLALKELISSASEEALEDHEDTLISVVRTALTDSDDEVRETAAEAFDSLQQILGKKAVDQVLPYLLNLLRSEADADNALSALLTLLTETTRSNIILPNLIPTLIAPPITAFDARALASLSRVAGSAMNRRLPNIINSLLDGIIQCQDDELRADLETSFDTVVLSIDEYDGLNTVMNVLLQLTKHEDHRRRAATCRHLAKFFAAGEVDYSRYNQDIIRALLISFDDRDSEVVKSAWSALSNFTKKLKKEEMEALVPSTRQTLKQVGVPGANLPGFELPKGINAILPIFLQGLMNGSPEQRTQAALAISDIIDRTSEASLKPFVTQITGPLIRVVSERSTEVKAAILLTLNNLLEKMPVALKPFLPQLQRTFAKSLADTSSELLRGRAAKALGALIKYTPRIDPLVAELVTGSKTSDPGVKTAMLSALYEVVSKAGSNMGEPSRAAVLSLIDHETSEADSNMTITNAKLLGALIKNVPEDVAQSLLKNRVVTSHISSSTVLALNAVLVESPDALLNSPLAEDLPDVLCQGIAHKTTFIAENFILATGKYLLSDCPKSFESNKKLFETLAATIQPGQPTDSRRLALVVVRTMSRVQMDLVRPHVPLLAGPVFGSVRDPVIPVKLAAEAAFIALFNVADEESKVFDKFVDTANLPPTTKRSMQDYFKRVALRLGAQVRERREAEGGQGGLGLSNDEVEDEKEIWSVGKVEVGEDIFGK